MNIQKITSRALIALALLTLVTACDNIAAIAPAATPTITSIQASPTAVPPTLTPATNLSSPTAADANDGFITISEEQQSTWTRNFNPLVPQNSARFPARAGIYEPLMIFNTMTGKYIPWLATDYKWSADNTQLTLTIRDDVKWTDGQAFTAEDAAFTFQLLKKFPTVDLSNVWDFLSDVRATDAKTLVFSFKKVNVPGFYYLVQQPIVSEHAWKDVTDAAKYADENPIGTGPFAIVSKFNAQVYELSRNPNYWQPGKPYLNGLRFTAYPTNDAANLAEVKGEVDWAGNFLPDIDKTYVSKSPDNHYWFPAVGGTVFLYANTTVKPFDNPDVRKAISMAINRDQIASVAEYGYTHAADATGLSDAFNSWKDPKIVASGTWTKLDVAKANQLLDAAGLVKNAAGIRVANGKPMHYDIQVVTGWSDWVATCQIIAQNLKAIGIEAAVKPSDYGAWIDVVQRGNYDLTIGWSNFGPDPYRTYREAMATELVKPIGTLSNVNWQRYGNTDADALLTKFVATSDPAQQKDLIVQLEKIFVEQAPAIPLFPGPVWGEYTTKHATGWPNKDNPYALLTPNNPPEYLILLTTIKPK